MYQFIVLFAILFWKIPRPAYMLVQTPPAVPILFLAHVVCWLRDSRLIIDWHNYGFSILQVAKRSRCYVTLYKWFEIFFGRGAHGNLCVSTAMRKDLEDNWGVHASVLYDRPPVEFRRANIEETHQLFLEHSFGARDPSQRSGGNCETAFTEINAMLGKVNMKSSRPILLVSSTSWTADENFDLLIDAMGYLEKLIHNDVKRFPPVRLVVTGKGELKEHFCQKWESMGLKNISLFTPFLTYQHYATLLGSCDLGICLHSSSSGIDLPMKIVDMFGCELPVCALEYPTLPELVTNGETGLFFSTSEELAKQIFKLFLEFPKTNQLDRFRENLKETQKRKWHENWKERALPMFSPYKRSHSNMFFLLVILFCSLLLFEVESFPGFDPPFFCAKGRR
eukprot:TRINITY_DN373_c0_g1_i26.p1 TRINITY_DN373_c0_g1~~TRINITY_DN373_c0_g1_i26.p1  ORF type:complete len:394 (-),score=67.28 TRINITY_DN373_c0_g1_i26:194-1375(-)